VVVGGDQPVVNTSNVEEGLEVEVRHGGPLVLDLN
jgi:hypothetical protein